MVQELSYHRGDRGLTIRSRNTDYGHVDFIDEQVDITADLSALILESSHPWVRHRDPRGNHSQVDGIQGRLIDITKVTGHIGQLTAQLEILDQRGTRIKDLELKSPTSPKPGDRAPSRTHANDGAAGGTGNELRHHRSPTSASMMRDQTGLALP